MATTGEGQSRVKTFISISYSIPNGPDHLMQQTVQQVKDENDVDFITLSDVTVDVGGKDDYKDRLQDNSDTFTTIRDDAFDKANDKIELIDEQIEEIDNL